MNKTRVEIESLSKQYEVRRPKPGLLWALNSVSLTADAGEIVGIIGRNGAGKSTLLKILAGITEPTSGHAKLWRRPASLLELGTGFHPDLSGRENVFLNAVLFGMRIREVRRKFDSICDFADIGEFIDTPVKHYSSGMAIRLAFSVAVHLDRELLLLDEALAVGDFAFQQKSVTRICQMAENGACVLLVSHNLGLIERVCTRALLLEKGQPHFLGGGFEAVREYLKLQGARPHEFVQPPCPEKTLQVRRVALVCSDGIPRSEVAYHEDFSIIVDYDVNRYIDGTNIGIGISAPGGALLFASAEFDCKPELRRARRPGPYRAQVKIPSKWLNSGRFAVQVYSANGPKLDKAQDALIFDVLDTGTPASRQGQSRTGVLQPELEWDVQDL